MSTLFIAAIIIVSLIGISVLLIKIHNKNQREATNRMLTHFSMLGTENNLSFSSQEKLKNLVFGLDGASRKVLVVTKDDNLFESFLINLEEIKRCTVKKIYSTVNANHSGKNSPEPYLEKMVLHFDRADKPPVEIVFYAHFVNHIFEIQDLERKAKSWELVFSRMLTPVKKIA